MLDLILATGNRHKFREIQTVLGSAVRCRSLIDLQDPPRLIEDADTFEGNAARKCVQLAIWLAGRSSPDSSPAAAYPMVLADDSGLEVDALNGAPGVRSARFAVGDPGVWENATDGANNAKLLHLLTGTSYEARTARFRCVLALWCRGPIPLSVAPPKLAEQVEFFEGVCEGSIGSQPQGDGGFGYDPLFTPKGHDRSFAEMDESMKNSISHRAKALQGLKSWLEHRGCHDNNWRYIG